jgi:hypothetical protein
MLNRLKELNFNLSKVNVTKLKTKMFNMVEKTSKLLVHNY